MSSKNFYGLTGDVTVDGGILNVGNAQLYANTETSNVGIGTTNAEFKLDVHGDANVQNLYATYLHGDGSNIENIVSSQWEGSPGDPIYYTSNVGIANTSPVTKTLQVGSNLYVEDAGSNVIHVTGNVYADYFVGDGSQLTGIAASLDQIVDQGNTVSNTIQLVSGQDATSNVGLVTHEGVSISVSNANPTGEYQFGVGSNLLVNVYSSNVLTVGGNVFAQKMTLGSVTVTPAYNLQQITETGPTTNQTLVLSNVTTGLTADANVVVNGNVTAGSMITSGNVNAGNVVTSSNIEVGGDLSVTGNVYIDDMRVAEVASNLVTYDSTTGELMDSGGLFSNKLAVVSEQPPIALTGASTLVTNHGTYTIEASSGTVVNLFDKNDSTNWETSLDTYVSATGVYDGSASLAGHGGEWVKITMPYKTILRHIKIVSTNSSIKDIELVGLNADGLTWTLLKSVTGLNEETPTIIVNATSHHKTYGLIVRATNVGSSQAEIGDLKLFTESFSIDGGKVEMASSAVMGGETTIDQHGPHGRGEAKLKKYPEIAFDASKVDTFGNSNAYTQAGYEISSSSRYSPSYDVLSAFNGTYLIDHFASKNLSFSTSSPYNYTLFTNNVTDKDSTQYTGEEIKVKMPYKIKLSKVQIISYVGASGRKVASGHIFGSNTGANGSWTKLADFTGLNTGTSGYETVSVSTTEYYEWYSLVVTNINGIEGLLNIYELEFYGYEELATQGDTSVDTTFTSIMNTPQTTGANVYTDAKLSSDFTNHVTGPTPVGTAAVHDNTNKYWEMNGQLTSNIAVEANTFLEGDAPHSVSVWFNSSNLEANVSNTCVFSISDQEKLDSMNLDLQSNTWHNLTYAYQGEGGSRVTYLDGRKVAEDQAEDTFGEYPPFAMTGNSQGGYVVSASSLRPSHQAWHAFDKTKYAAGVGEKWASEASQGDTFTGGNSLYDGTNRLSSSTPYGAWLKIELPHKIRLQYISLFSDPTTEQPKDFIIYGSNDDNTWDQLFQKTGATENADYVNYTINSVSCYKYFGLVIRRLISSTTIAAIDEWKLYGHRENDLVRLPDPTNVLKYPHIAMTGPAQRGYVVTASNEDTADTYYSWKAFDNGTGTISQVGWYTNENGNYNGANGTVTSTSTVRLAPETEKGDWLQLEFPYFFHLDYFVLYSQSDSPTVNTPDNFILYARKNSSDTWTSLGTHTGTAAGQSAAGYTGTVDGSEVYKYFAIVVTKRFQQNSVGGISIRELEFYGTEENSSIPIQIGGGNIDKVANFRVYDKFIGEDQALEIWDAQKDEFGRAKSSMTLQKGRLGIGTTEPEGRLAVADEPHNLEEFPPRAMTANETHMEGHGVFKAFKAENITGYAPHRAFDKDPDVLWAHDNTPYDTNGNYVGGGDGLRPITFEPVNDVGVFPAGEWIGLELPYKIKPDHFIITARNSGQHPQEFPRKFSVYATSDGYTWVLLKTFDNIDSPGQAAKTAPLLIHSNETYKSFVWIWEKIQGSAAVGGSANQEITVSNISLFGTREQGQSVLHDGQLTLTKSLTVPRIGPALDADDTPRRDRLVVEYNTSTNPTSEGAVRDTSGRGNDGILHSSVSYDANEKSFGSFGGGGLETMATNNLLESNGKHSFSAWIRFDTSGAWYAVYGIGGNIDNSGNNSITVYIGSGVFRVEANGGSYRDYGYTFNHGKWVHMAVVYDGTGGFDNFDIYMDTVKLSQGSSSDAGTAAITLPTQNQTVRFGSTAEESPGATSTNYLDGAMSSIKFYDTVLTAEEVKTLYDMGRCDEGHHVVNFSKTRVGIGLGDGEAPRGVLDVRGSMMINGIIKYGAWPAFRVTPNINESIFSNYSGATDEKSSGHNNNNNDANEVIPWKNVVYDKTGSYTYSGAGDYKFTAPISGIYHFHFHCLFSRVSTVASRLDLKFYVNGSNNAHLEMNGDFSSSGSPNVGRGHTTNIHLNAGDYVQTIFTGIGDEWGVYTSGGYNIFNVFSGQLIAAD
jgi:cytoskeletal protein CcmA (bactofilin family)